jgi:small subunit ribosomal protein S18
MAKQDQQRSRKRPPLGGPQRKRNCFFCKDKVDEVDYKNVNQLRRYVSEKGKIRSRRITGACRRHQNQVSVAVKRAREMALLPYVAEGREDRGPRDRGDRGDRGDRDRGERS